MTTQRLLLLYHRSQKNQNVKEIEVPAVLLRNILRDAGEELIGLFLKEGHDLKAAKFLSATSPKTSCLIEEATGMDAQTTVFSDCVMPHVSARTASSLRRVP